MHLNKQIKYAAGASVIIIALLLYFTRSFGEAFRLSAAMIGIWLLPGYGAMQLLAPDMEEIEKILIGIFFGSSIVALVLYFPSILGIPSVQPVLGYVLGVLGLIVLWRKGDKE